MGDANDQYYRDQQQNSIPISIPTQLYIPNSPLTPPQGMNGMDGTAGQSPPPTISLGVDAYGNTVQQTSFIIQQPTDTSSPMFAPSSFPGQLNTMLHGSLDSNNYDSPGIMAMAMNYPNQMMPPMALPGVGVQGDMMMGGGGSHFFYEDNPNPNANANANAGRMQPPSDNNPGHPIQTTGEKVGPEGSNLFIFHIPGDLKNTALFQLFLPFGNLLSVRIMTEFGTHRSRGFGFVSYDNSKSANDAIVAMNGYPIGKKRLKVQLKTADSHHPGGHNPNPVNYNNNEEAVYGQSDTNVNMNMNMVASALEVANLASSNEEDENEDENEEGGEGEGEGEGENEGENESENESENENENDEEKKTKYRVVDGVVDANSNHQKAN